MHEKTVYAKSAKGREEIATRAHKLGFKQRALLIMVDGAATVSELGVKAEHLGQIGILLTQLRDGGFIEPAGSEPSPLPHTAPPRSPPPTATQLQDLADAKVHAAQFLRDALGADAADLSARIENSETIDDYLAEVERCKAILVHAAGAKVAEDFWREIVERLG